MKYNYAWLGVSLCLCLLFSCKKNEINPDEVRLLGFETKDSSGTTYKTVFDYDNSGKIIKAHSEYNGQNNVLATIAYQNNQIIITHPPIKDASLTVFDSIILILDAANRVQEKVSYSFFETKPPVSDPQRTYTYDTTFYVYDASGLLEKSVIKSFDSTWFNPVGRIETYVTLTNSLSSYVNANGNLSSINKTSETNSYTNQNGRNLYTKRSATVNTSFEYTKKYPNKTDFTNTAILYEADLIGLNFPINKNYKNLPDKIKQSVTEKDQAGAVISSYNNNSDVSMKYNSYGFIGEIDGLKFIYNK